MQLIDRFIEAECHRDLGPGAEQPLVNDGLRVGDSSALALELESEAVTTVDDEDVGHPGGDAERLEDRSLNRLTVATVGDMEKKLSGTPRACKCRITAR